jgi:hypothetical protein|uniref:Uncharacterized protein n=1 Tax=viral metagenome TaxID=1070528 RepID=A0A6C0IM06_9ZZZZ
MTDIDIIGGSPNETFVQHVFKFDEQSKKEMMNVIQYTIIALFPVVSLNKLMQKYVPEADDEKGSVELLAEIVIQLIIMFVGILLINRAVTFVPTYSEMKYEQFSIIHMIPATLMIILSLQTKLGEKVSILYDRVEELIMGKKEGFGAKEDAGSQNNVKRQPTPLSGASSPGEPGNPSMPVTSPGMPMSTQPSGTTGINNLRPEPQSETTGNQQLSSNDGFEPMAANDAFGGGSFGSLW